MAKFSISVPDPEWERARAVGGDLNASQLVQTALRQFIESRTTKPAFAQAPPAEAEPLIDDARQKLATQARRAYERGYLAGAQFGKDEASWGAVELLERFSWDYDKWVGALRYDWESVREYGDVYEYFQSLDEENYFGPGSVWKSGFSSALRDVWRAVTEGSDSAVGDGKQTRAE